MSSSQSTTRPTPPPSPAEALVRLDQGLATFDTERTAGYTGAAAVRRAKGRSLAREHRLLQLAGAEDDDPRLAAIAARVEHNNRLQREVALAREVAETPAPAVGKETYAVHGFVRRRADQQGVPGVTVAVIDADGTWVRQLGYACTDERGYYHLATGRAGGKETDTIQPNRGPASDTGAAPGSSTAPQPEAAVRFAASLATTNTRVRYSVRAFDREGGTLGTAADPLDPAPGKVEMRIVLIGGDKPACVPPPEKPGQPPRPPGPVVPAPTPAPNPRPAPSPAPAPRVSLVKPTVLAPAPGREGEPLEAIRGIGPKRADALRKAGIDDVAEFERTPGAVITKVAGRDKVPPKPKAAKTTTAKPKSKSAKKKSSSR